MNQWTFLHIFYENGERKSAELWWIVVNKAKRTVIDSWKQNWPLIFQIYNLFKQYWFKTLGLNK